MALGAMVWLSFGPRLPSGDEPHYLVIAQSLLIDGDLQIENNHRARDYATFVDGDLAPHSLRRGTTTPSTRFMHPACRRSSRRSLPWRVIEAPRRPSSGLAGLAGALIWWIGWVVCRDRAAAWFAWARSRRR